MRLPGLVLLAAAAFTGCSAPQPTPPDVEEEYGALLQELDGELPGASVQRLTDFVARNRDFDIVAEAERAIDRLRSLADVRYGEARELARGGDFDRAEELLQDLALHLPDTPAGESAKEHLAFDFHYGKAQGLMARQRWDEAREVARTLLERDLTRAQTDQVEAVLDAASYVGAAQAEATRVQTQAVTRQIVIFLEMMYQDEGRYPTSLSLSDVAEWDPVGSRSTLRALSAIEDYETTASGYSFTAVSADGRHRIRVVDGEIER